MVHGTFLLMLSGKETCIFISWTVPLSFSIRYWDRNVSGVTSMRFSFMEFQRFAKTYANGVLCYKIVQ